MDHPSLAPALLLAMPQLDDPNFHRSVILLCRADAEGGMGLVLNRPTQTLVSDVVDFDPPLAADNHACTWIGGPVEPHRGWILVGGKGGYPDAQELAPGVHLSGSMGLLRRIVEDASPPPSRFLLGYAGWGSGQLEAEIAQSAWLISEPSPDLIFATPAESAWETAIRRLGVEPFALQAGGGVH